VSEWLCLQLINQKQILKFVLVQSSGGASASNQFAGDPPNVGPGHYDGITTHSRRGFVGCLVCPALEYGFLVELVGWSTL
jgi:hypothetical protein